MQLYMSPNGRIDQAVYWKAVLILFIVSTLINAATFFVSPLIGLLSFVVMWSWIAIHAKRFHDNGKTGWYMLLLILIAAVVGQVISMVLPGLFGFDQLAYNQRMEEVASSGDFSGMMDLINEGNRALFLPGTISTLVVTFVLGFIMSRFKTDPNDNQYGPGPGGMDHSFS